MLSRAVKAAHAGIDAARANPAAAAVAIGVGAAGAAAVYALATREQEEIRPRRAPGIVHLVGSGIANMTAALELLQHRVTQGCNIHIYEECSTEGGCLDGCGDAENGYVCRGGRMFDTEEYLCVWSVMKRVPSAERPGKTAYDDYVDYNKTFKTSGQARLVASGGKNLMKINGRTMGLSMRDRLEMVKMLAINEECLGRKGINEFFNPHFFTTPFWYMWSTTFAFQPWHSAIEFKRYMHKFQHEFAKMFGLEGVKRTKYNQYDSLALPVRKYLVSQGVQFHLNTRVVDTKFGMCPNGKYRCEALVIEFPEKKEAEVVRLAPQDTAIFTVGSMVADATLGYTDKAPAPAHPDGVQSWSFRLWQRMAQQLPKDIVGNPENFLHRVPESAWHSFSCTFKDDNTFIERMEQWTGNRPGTGALVTIVDSPWYMSTVIPEAPHFMGQPDNIKTLWGYALNLNTPGKFVKKPIVECTGAEIMVELMGHMNLWTEEEQKRIHAHTITIPCYMPYITSMFLTRERSDRAQCVSKKADNFAFVGQYTEIPDDCVFTVDMSARLGMTAVRKLFGVPELKVPAIEYINDPITLLSAVKTSFQ